MVQCAEYCVLVHDVACELASAWVLTACPWNGVAGAMQASRDISRAHASRPCSCAETAGGRLTVVLLTTRPSMRSRSVSDAMSAFSSSVRSGAICGGRQPAPYVSARHDITSKREPVLCWAPFVHIGTCLVKGRANALWWCGASCRDDGQLYCQSKAQFASADG